MPAQRNWTQLEGRIQAFEAERDVMRLLHAYGPALDYGDEDGWVELFTADGVFEVVRPPLTHLREHSELRMLSEKRHRHRDVAEIPGVRVTDQRISESNLVGECSRRCVRGVRPSERPPVRAVGRDQLRAIAHSHSRAPERLHKHCTVNPRVEIDGGAASAVSYFLLLIEHETWPVIRTFGRYVDRLICCGDHRWRFEHRTVEIESERPDIPRLMNSRGLGRRGGDTADGD